MMYGNNIFTRFDLVSLHMIIMQGAYQMNQGKSIFAQVMSLFPEYIFHQCVARYNGDRHKIKFTCRDQFMVMSFAQFTSQQSLRTNEAALTAFESKLYHSGLSLIPHSTLADLNKTKDKYIYHNLTQYLIKKARKLYDKDYYRLDIGNNNIKAEVVAERPIYESTGIISYQHLMLTRLKKLQYYKERIRMVVYEDYATNNVYTFITNDF